MKIYMLQLIVKNACVYQWPKAQDCQIKTDESKGPGKQNKNILSYILVC